MKYLLIILLVLAVICIISLIAGAKWIRIRNYYVASDKLNNTSTVTRIVFITDLHEKSFGYKNQKLIEKIDQLDPDAIFIGGDTVDSYSKVGGDYIPLFEELPKLAKTFLVLGNHEYSAKRDMEIIGYAQSFGIRVLEDEFEPFTCNSDTINIIGMTDYFSENVVTKTLAERFDAVPVPYYAQRFNILLCHRPCELEEMSKRGIDLMVCGHTHGGQMRIPFVGGVFTPSSFKLFPKYDMGYFGIGKMDLIISSGLGTSSIPLRLFCRPEITVIDLQGKLPYQPKKKR